MTSHSFSAARYVDQEAREEMRFLREIKAVARQDVADAMSRDKLNQEQLASRLGMDAAQLSRLLSPERHNTTKSLFNLLLRLGKRWQFSSSDIPGRGHNSRGQTSHEAATPTLKQPIITINSF